MKTILTDEFDHSNLVLLLLPSISSCKQSNLSRLPCSNDAHNNNNQFESQISHSSIKQSNILFSPSSVDMRTFSNHKLAIDLLISLLATFILTTSLLSISTNNWNIKHEGSTVNRTGLFQQCSNTFCCEKKELDRSITLFTALSIILLTTSTLSSFLFMSIGVNSKTCSYILVPLTLFAAGISMTLTLIQILDRLSLNGYSAMTFMIDTILAYLLGGISLIHANMFYF